MHPSHETDVRDPRRALGTVSEAVLAGPRRILIASPMKCASTYVAGTLAQYLGIDVPELEYDWLAEQNLTYELRRQVRGRPFVLSLHMRPHAGNLAAARDDDVHVALLWRNIGDVVVSFDEHVPRYGAHNPIFFLDGEPFMRMPEQERYRFLIDALVPWSAGFYLHWSRLPSAPPFNPYGLLVADPPAYFRRILAGLGIELDEARLRAAVATRPAFTRLNKGVFGRSAERFDAETKRRLERRILQNPGRDELEVLLWELPWEPLLLPRGSPRRREELARAWVAAALR